MVHMFHRFLSLLVGVIVLASLVRIWLLKDRQPWLKQLTVLVGSLFLAQILVGAVDVRLAFPTSINILHLAAATAVWASLVALAALSHPLTIEDAEGSNAT